ncbi:hypothetical protein ACLOJK_005296 [Asimina triloba]
MRFVNEFILKARVKLSFEFRIAKGLNVSKVSIAGKKSTKVVGNILDLVEEWKMTFFFIKLKGSDKIEEIRNPRKATPTPLLTRVLQVEPLEIEELAKVYSKTKEEVMEEQGKGLPGEKLQDHVGRGQMLEVEDELLLRAVLLEAASLQKLRAAFEAIKTRSKAKGMEGLRVRN